MSRRRKGILALSVPYNQGMDVRAYLERIGYGGPWEASAEVLHGLHVAHLQSVPFENLSVALKEPIRLDLEGLFEKIVRRRRGGFCYELNGLFGALLEEAGFVVSYLSSRGIEEDGRLCPEFDHLTLRVGLPGEKEMPWLADVGWGDSFLEPLRLDRTEEQPQGLRAYRIEADEEYRILWQRNYDGSWERQHRFTFQPRAFPQDFEEMCVYHQTSPDSTFTRQRMCTLATPEGRVSLFDTRLLTTAHGVVSAQPVVEEARAEILRDQFGILLD